MHAAPAGAARLGSRRAARAAPPAPPSRVAPPLPAQPRRAASRHPAQAGAGEARAADPANDAKVAKRYAARRKPRDLPALENALQAAADAETVLPPTRTEEELFADVEVVRGAPRPRKAAALRRREAPRGALGRKRARPLALAAR